MDVYSRVFLDASKPFDRVKHSMLFTKKIIVKTAPQIYRKIAPVLVCASDNVC